MSKPLFWKALLLTAAVWLPPAAASTAVPMIPVFTPEPIGMFAAALRGQRRAVLDVQHTNGLKYHAYRFLDPNMVLIGVARAIFIDANGRVNIAQAHGQPMGGHRNLTHQEYSHVLLPIGVNPP